MRDRTKYIGGSDLGGILNVCDHSSGIGKLAVKPKK